MTNFILRPAGRALVLFRGLSLLILILALRTVDGLGGDYGEFFQLSGKVTLQDSKVKFASIATAEVGYSGRIIGVNKTLEKGNIRSLRALQIFSPQGRLLKNIGLQELEKIFDREKVTGNVYMFDVTESQQGWLFATTKREILIFDSLGVFKKLIQLGNPNPKSQEEIWGSNVARLDIDPKGEIIVGAGVGYPVPKLLHTYDKNGKLLKEFLQLDSQFVRRKTKDPSVDVDSTGEIWCVSPFHYKIFHYGMDGAPKQPVVGKSSVFKLPADLKEPKPRKKWLHWIKTWTPVVDCAVTQSGHVLLVMLAGEKGKPFVKDYNPELSIESGGFFIDVYDREGNMMAGGLYTPHRFLCVDKQDNLWFDLRPATPENPTQDGPAILGKFRLKLPAVAPKALSR